MTKNLKFFLIALILSIGFWWGVNILEEKLENFFYWHKLATNPQLLAAQASQQALEQKLLEQKKLRNLKPIRNQEVENFKTGARSVISVFINGKGEEKILFEKNIDQKLPIASLTKLMTAYIVLEYYDLSQKIKISQEAVSQEGELGNLEVGRIFSVEYLLYPLLIESSNDAAYALAEVIGQEAFVHLMNLEAQDLGLKNTYFVNPTGLDPDEPDQIINYSTAKDLVKLTKHLLEKQPLIWEILSIPKFTLYGPELINTNELLEEIPSIISGKTGETPRAKGCLLLISRAPKDRGYLINIILGSEERFEEMKKLIEWVAKAYRW